jgi:hypothetical protein
LRTATATAETHTEPDSAIVAPERFVCGNLQLDSDRAGQWYERLAEYASATGAVIVEDEITISVPPGGGSFRPHHPLGVIPLAVIASSRLRSGIWLRSGADEWTHTRVSLVCGAVDVKFRAWVIGIHENADRTLKRTKLAVVADHETESSSNG